MCCICSMHVYSSALCLEWNDHSDVFFITEQHFLRLWCFMYRAIIAICHLGAWSMANLQSFDACNNYYYWCHCTIFKIWTSHCKSAVNRKERQSALEIPCWKTSEGVWDEIPQAPWGTDCECRGSGSRRVMQCVCWPLHWEQLWETQSWGSPNDIFWQSGFEVWPWTQAHSMFQQLLHLGLWVIFFCALCHWHSGDHIHSNHGFQTWLSWIPGSASELSPPFLWNLSLNRLLIGILSWMFSMQAANVCACINTFNLLKCTLQVSNYTETNCINVFS